MKNEEILRFTLSREQGFDHSTFEEDREQYRLIREGDPAAAEAAERMFRRDNTGGLSPDPLTNIKYMFVMVASLGCFAALEGGADRGETYDTSAHYIRRADSMDKIDEVCRLVPQMAGEFAELVRSAKGAPVPLPVRRAVEYLRHHLNEKLTVRQLSGLVGLSPAHLSRLFARYLGMGVGEFVRRERVQAAKLLLQDPSYTLSVIAETLGFSSQSHFTQVFRALEGVTPGEYRSGL